MNSHQKVETSKQHVKAIADSLHEHGHDKVEEPVEEPVGGGGHGNGDGAYTQRVDFCGIDPSKRTPGGCKGGDEKVDGCHHAVGSVMVIHIHHPLSTFVLVPVALAHETANDPEEEGHEQRTENHGRATAPLVNKQDRRYSHDNVDYVVDTGSQERRFLRVADTGLLEHQYDVEHDDIHACQLLPDLKTHAEGDAVCHAWFQKITVPVRCDFSIKLDSRLNFLDFLHEESVIYLSLFAE